MDIDIVDGDDWKGVYINGKLVYEDHDLYYGDLLTLLGVEYKVHWPDLDWLYDIGTLPETLEDVELGGE